MSNTVIISGRGSTNQLTGLDAKIREVSFDTGVKVAVDKSQISAPHWKEGEKVKYEQKGYGAEKVSYGVCSRKPAVYAITNNAGGCFLDVKVDITKLKNVSGTGILHGNLASLKMEGEFPLALGVNPVRLKITDPPDAIKWFKGDIMWHFQVKDKPQVRILNKTFAEVFFILDRPADFYKPGIWAEALRFLCKRAGILNGKDEKKVTRQIT
ncbi:MAG: hypothetical protein ABFD63_10170, partial [Smithella sp.]